MGADNVVLLIICAGMIFYLLYALLQPHKF
jgi:K+-transporting ATPase KdpF subunit